MRRSRDARGVGVGKVSRSDSISDLSVVVLGGFVMDAVIRIPELPQWGQAVQADSFEFVPGGKGFNQAIAARRIGAKVAVVGAVGSDAFGEQIIKALEMQEITTSGLAVVQDAVTPVTVVFGNATGETSFVGWKNDKSVKVDSALVKDQRRLISEADVILITLEVPPEAVSQCIAIAQSYSALTVLNPAPPLDRPYKLSDLPLKKIDLLIPNEWEARELAGGRGAPRFTIQQVTEYLGDSDGAKCVCVTRAHEGCAVYNDGRYREYAAYEVEASDTTGASDAFCSVLAIYKRAGYETEEAVHMAQAAGAYVVTRRGASLHMPDREGLERYRRHLDRERLA